MKKTILKLLLVPSLIATPVMSVVACGSASTFQPTDNDILNSAVNHMQEYTFNMDDVKLGKLPDDKSNFSALTTDTKNQILAHFAALVTPGPTWEFKKVSVAFAQNQADWLVTNQFHGKVNVTIPITLSLSLGKEKAKTTTIKIYINNNKSSDETKAQEVSDFLKEYLTDAGNSIEVKTALIDFESGLKQILFASKDPVVDVPNVDLKVSGLTKDALLYQLDDKALNETDAKNPKITGTFTNLTFTVIYRDSPQTFNFATEKIAVAQDFADTQNEVAAIIGNKLDSSYTVPNLPHENQAFKDFDTDNKIAQWIIAYYYKIITSVYETGKIDANWAADKVLIVNGDKVPFNSKTNSFANVGLTFSFTSPANNKILATNSINVPLQKSS